MVIDINAYNAQRAKEQLSQLGCGCWRSPVHSTITSTQCDNEKPLETPLAVPSMGCLPVYTRRRETFDCEVLLLPPLIAVTP